MKLRKCLMCGSWFEAFHGTQHTCDGCEWFVQDEERQWKRIEAELTDPQVKARIEAGLAKNPLWRKEGEKQPQAGVRKEMGEA